MNKIYEIYNLIFGQQKAVLAMIGLVVLILLLLVIPGIISFNNPDTTPSPEPTLQPASSDPPVSKGGPPILFRNNPSSETATQIQNQSKTEVGKTTKQEVIKLPNLKSTKTRPDGMTEYTFASTTKRDNLLVLRDDVVVFKRYVPFDPQTKQYPKVFDYEDKFGMPDTSFEGSKYYGQKTLTYIYASQGFAIINDLDTGDVYEIHTFVPENQPSGYINKWGEDLD